jgi:hypothetical protein
MEYYHGKEHAMWQKGCIYLGSFTCSEGYNYDLGIYEWEMGPSFAVVTGPEEHEYNSGRLCDNWANGYDEPSRETAKRYKEYKVWRGLWQSLESE